VQRCLTLHELLASDVTRAVLRADAMDIQSFETTLQAAVARLRACQRKALSCPEDPRLGPHNPQD
jgi:hypothetical protein